MINSSEAASPLPSKAGVLLTPNAIITSPNLSAIASAGLRSSPISKSPKSLAHPSPRSLIPLTGAAAHADERRIQERARMQNRRQSPNPASSALDALLRPQSGISRRQDAPTATGTTSDGLAIAVNAITSPDSMQIDQKPQASPQSMSSLASFSGRAPTVTATSVRADSPRTSNAGGIASEREAEHGQRDRVDEGAASQSEARSSNRAFTFPGNRLDILPDEDTRDPVRGMSLPMPEAQNTPRSSSGSSKKHKCPYCSTEFTRHHNLKSHLLTHSHEKPFVCSTCQQRFRRLHDLKRHTKLHTGERPHICPKCKRRFARGDALARHNKGHGGCAGRRSSVGSYGGNEGGNDEYADNEQDRMDAASREGESGDGMDGVLYGDDSSQLERLDDESEAASSRRRQSLPSIKAQDLPPSSVHHPTGSSPGAAPYSPDRSASTYPPAARHAPAPYSGERSAPLGKLLSGTSHAGSSAGPASVRSPHHLGLGPAPPSSNATASSVFGPVGMTESPKPLSPGAAASHQLGMTDSSTRTHPSPNLRQHFQTQHNPYGRRGTEGASSPRGLPPLAGNSHSTQLPPLSGFAAPDTRFTVPSQAGGGSHPGPGLGQTAPASYQQSVAAGPASSALSHSTTTSLGGGSASSHGPMSGEGAHNPYSGNPDGLWAYVRTLEDRLNRLADEVVGLKDELARRDRR